MTSGVDRWTSRRTSFSQVEPSLSRVPETLTKSQPQERPLPTEERPSPRGRANRFTRWTWLPECTVTPLEEGPRRENVQELGISFIDGGVFY